VKFLIFLILAAAAFGHEFEFGKSEIFANDTNAIVLRNTGCDGAVCVDFAKFGGVEYFISGCNGDEMGYKCKMMDLSETEICTKDASKCANLGRQIQLSRIENLLKIKGVKESLKLTNSLNLFFCRFKSPKLEYSKQIFFDGEEQRFLIANYQDFLETKANLGGKSANLQMQDAVIYADLKRLAVANYESVDYEYKFPRVKVEIKAFYNSKLIQISDFIADEAKFNAFILAALKKQPYAKALNKSLKIEKIKNFYLENGKLVVIFNPNEIAPANAGIFELKLEFDEIKGFLKDGAAEFFN